MQLIAHIVNGSATSIPISLPIFLRVTRNDLKFCTSFGGTKATHLLR